LKIDEDFRPFQACVALAVEAMAGFDHSATPQRSTDNLEKIPASPQEKLAVLNFILNAHIKSVETSPRKHINFDFLESTLGISRASNLSSLNFIVINLTEIVAASSRIEPIVSKVSIRDSTPAFSMYGETIEFLSKALKVYQFQRLPDRALIHCIHTLVILLFEISANMNSVAFMGNTALLCHDYLLNILDDAQKLKISCAILDYLSPKLQQLQMGKISALNYEAIISTALRLSTVSSVYNGIHQMVRSTALFICNSGEKIS
jgi:hypothetical protein